MNIQKMCASITRAYREAGFDGPIKIVAEQQVMLAIATEMDSQIWLDTNKNAMPKDVLAMIGDVWFVTGQPRVCGEQTV